MSTKIISVCLTIICGLLLIVLIAVPQKQTSTVKIGMLPTITATLPHWIAMEKGFYKEEGLSVEIYPNSSSASLVQAMINKEIDYVPGVATVDVMNAFASQSNQLKATIISHTQITKDEPFTALLVTKNSKIATLKDVEGKKIAVFPGNTAGAALKVFLNLKGVDIANISIIPVPPPEHITVLQSGDVDVSFAYEPLRSQLLEKYGAGEIYSGVYESLNAPAAIGVTIVSNEFIRNNNDAFRKLTSAWNKAIDFIANNNVEAREILGKNMKLEQAVANRASWIKATRSTNIDFSVLKKEVEQYQAMGIINRNFELQQEMVVK